MRSAPTVFDAIESGVARRRLARLVGAAGAFLERVALALGAEPRPRRGEPVLEFHAEAGAPEGALYVDGELVGRIAGVTRL